ncbi:hypothetical protein SynMINOS11_01967 [Synechococcus sp. Minos11]|nr:hypothetical protein SynMINOS11_01967 [Synechococcus sp. Minos11]
MQRSIRRLATQQGSGVSEDHRKTAGLCIERQKRLPELPKALIQAKGDHPLTAFNQLLAGPCLKQFREGVF